MPIPPFITQAAGQAAGVVGNYALGQAKNYVFGQPQQPNLTSSSNASVSSAQSNTLLASSATAASAAQTLPIDNPTFQSSSAGASSPASGQGAGTSGSSASLAAGRGAANGLPSSPASGRGRGAGGLPSSPAAGRGRANGLPSGPASGRGKGANGSTLSPTAPPGGVATDSAQSPVVGAGSGTTGISSSPAADRGRASSGLPSSPAAGRGRGTSGLPSSPAAGRGRGTGGLLSSPATGRGGGGAGSTAVPPPANVRPMRFLDGGFNAAQFIYFKTDLRCHSCQESKSECDTSQPSCATCRQIRAKCTYDTYESYGDTFSAESQGLVMDAQDIATLKKAIGDAVAWATLATQIQPTDPDYQEVFKSPRFFDAVKKVYTKLSALQQALDNNQQGFVKGAVCMSKFGPTRNQSPANSPNTVARATSERDPEGNEIGVKEIRLLNPFWTRPDLGSSDQYNTVDDLKNTKAWIILHEFVHLVSQNMPAMDTIATLYRRLRSTEADIVSRFQIKKIVDVHIHQFASPADETTFKNEPFMRPNTQGYTSPNVKGLAKLEYGDFGSVMNADGYVVLAAERWLAASKKGRRTGAAGAPAASTAASTTSASAGSNAAPAASAARTPATAQTAA